jgi:hypothetical protein
MARKLYPPVLQRWGFSPTDPHFPFSGNRQTGSCARLLRGNARVRLGCRYELGLRPSAGPRDLQPDRFGMRGPGSLVSAGVPRFHVLLCTDQLVLVGHADSVIYIAPCGSHHWQKAPPSPLSISDAAAASSQHRDVRRFRITDGVVDHRRSPAVARDGQVILADELNLN